MNKITIDTKKGYSLNDLTKTISELPKGMYEIVIQKPKRTNKQNRAMHLYFQQLSDHLNFDGHFCRVTTADTNIFKDDFEVPWNPVLIKEFLWRPVQIGMYKKESSTELTTKELSEVAKYIEDNLAKRGVNAEFPNIEALFYGRK